MYQFDERFVIHGLAATQSLSMFKIICSMPPLKGKAPEPISASAPSSNNASISAPRLSSASLLESNDMSNRTQKNDTLADLSGYQFKIQNGLAVVAKAGRIALESPLPKGELALKPVEFGPSSPICEPTLTSIDFAGTGKAQANVTSPEPTSALSASVHAARKLYISAPGGKGRNVTDDTGNLPDKAGPHAR